MLTKKNCKAYAVLAILMDIMDDPFDVRGYVNGREEGFFVESGYSGNGWGVAFSESRNSDAIVVYTGHKWDFDTSGHIPNEEMYQNRKFFCQNYSEAAEFVKNFLMQPQKKPSRIALTTFKFPNETS